MIDTSLESGAQRGGSLLITPPISHSICLCLHLFLSLSVLLCARPPFYIYCSRLSLSFYIYRSVFIYAGCLYMGVYICPFLYFSSLSGRSSCSPLIICIVILALSTTCLLLALEGQRSSRNLSSYVCFAVPSLSNCAVATGSVCVSEDPGGEACRVIY